MSIRAFLMDAYLIEGLRFSAGIDIETTKFESNMALVKAERTTVTNPLVKKLKTIRKPKK